MGDPTGLVGAVVSKLLNAVLEELGKIRKSDKYARNLQHLLKEIRPWVDQASAAANPTDLSYNNESAKKGNQEVERWLRDLDALLKEAYSLVQECNRMSFYDVGSRHKMSGKILSVTRRINKSLDFAQLVGVNLLQDVLLVMKSFEPAMKDLEVALNCRTVGDVTRQFVQTEGMPASQAFREIKTRTDKLASSVYRGQDYDQNDGLQQEPDEQPMEDFVVGMDVPVAHLKQILIDGRSSRWAGVWGKGGVGKTLLAMRVCNSKEVQDHFGSPIWLQVGRQPSVERLQRKLCSMLDINVRHSESKEDAKARIYNALRRKKKLLVLDDVWEADVLDWLDVVDRDLEQVGSKILVTTRNLQVLAPKDPADELTVKLECLSKDDSWELFCHHAFGGVNKLPIASLPEDLVQKVAEECKGLPLALKVIAGAQASQRSPQQWQRALTKLKEAEALDVEHDKQLYKRLQLSYDALTTLDSSGRLQKCFIYFAAFPEDDNVDVERLVELWAGEKLLETSEDTDSDPAPDGYYLLGVLVGRSLIDLDSLNPATQGWSPNLNAPALKCRIHDVLRDMALYLVRQQISRVVSELTS